MKFDIVSLENMLKRHEGTILHAYDDYNGREIKPKTFVEGQVTIGIGRNLVDKGISQEEAEYLLRNDIKEVYYDLHTRVKGFKALSFVRKAVLVNMAFNMGINKMMKFAKMLKHIEEQDYHKASKEMLLSKWAKQVGYRAIEMSESMKNNQM